MRRRALILAVFTAVSSYVTFSTIRVDAQGSGTPFGGAAVQLPGLIQAENFNDGNPDVAYHDADAANNGDATAYRPGTQVDIECATDPPDPGGCPNAYSIGWAGAGEWLNYTVNVVAAGTYSIGVRVASNGGGGTFHIEVDGVDKTGSMSVPNTSGWQTWKTVYKTGVSLNSGQHVWRVVMDANGSTGAVGNFNWIAVSQVFGASTPTLPGAMLQLEDFDDGGADVGYKDNDPTNQGGQYRATAVDIENTTDTGGGYSIGWAFAGEWLKYTVNVSSAGNYHINVRVASEGSGGTFHIEVNGSDVTGPMTVPDTSGWQSWVTITKPNVALSAGPQVWRLVMDSNGPTTAVGNFNNINLSSSAGSPELVVYSWNLQVDSYQTRAQGQMHYISTLQPLPHVVVLQEAEGSIPLSVYINQLTSDTGLTWTGVRFADPSHIGLDGTIIATSLPVTDSEWRPVGGCDNWAPNRYAIRTAVTFNGSTIQIFNTHLQARSFEPGPNSPNCPDNPDGDRHPERQAAINDIRSWAAEPQFNAVPILVGGDFNAQPFFGEIADPSTGMTSTFNDAWVLSGNPTSGYTHKMIGYCDMTQVDHRIDYWFSDKLTSWSVLEASVPTGGESCFAGYPSDHLGVLVRYRLP